MSPGDTQHWGVARGLLAHGRRGSQSPEERKRAELALHPVRTVLSTTSHTRMLGNTMEHVSSAIVFRHPQIFSLGTFFLIDCQIQVLALKRNKHSKKKVFPSGSDGNGSTHNAGDLGSIHGLEKSPGEGNGYPLQYSGLENSMDCIVHGAPKGWPQLSDFRFFMS